MPGRKPYVAPELKEIAADDPRAVALHAQVPRFVTVDRSTGRIALSATEIAQIRAAGLGLASFFTAEELSAALTNAKERADHVRYLRYWPPGPSDPPMTTGHTCGILGPCDGKHH